MSGRRRRVLFVSYAFPPTGGVGVQRVTKFVKYLPEYGWDCSVLTVENPSVPLIDETLLGEIPPSTIVRRTRTWEPGYAVKRAVSASGDGGRGNLLVRTLKGAARRVVGGLLQPDPQILWRRPALRAGLKLLAESRHDVIVATGPPFSSLLLGSTLKKKTGIPLVLDYRDEWGISNAYWENKRPGPVARYVQNRMQRHCLRAADLVLATTPSSTAAIANVAAEAGSGCGSACITNGFDPPDFAHYETTTGPRPDYGQGIDRFRLTFVGTLWALNPIGPLVDAIERLARTSPRLLEQLELVLAGRRTAEQEAMLDRLQGLPCSVVRLPFVSHDEACRLMRAADALLLLNADYPETHRIINAKTFEYMAARRLMFVIAPEGDIHDVVRDLPGSVLGNPRDPGQIAEQLALQLEQHRCGVSCEGTAWDISRFERRQLAGELGDQLDRLAGARAVEPSYSVH